MVDKASDDLDQVFYALADPTRREILRRVAQREHTVTELAKPFDMSLAAVSKHIKVLERASLLRQTREGRIHRCQFDPTPLKDVTALIAYLEGFWGERLASLEQFLREQEDNALSSSSKATLPKRTAARKKI